MDTMDNPTFPIRPVDEPGLEEINSAGIDQYDRNGGGDAVEKNNSQGECTVRACLFEVVDCSKEQN